MPQRHVHVVHFHPSLPVVPQVRCNVTSNLPSSACQMEWWFLSIRFPYFISTSRCTTISVQATTLPA